MTAKKLRLLDLSARDPVAVQALGQVPSEFIIIGMRVVSKDGQNAMPEAPEWAIRELTKFAGGDGFYTLTEQNDSGGYNGVNPWRRETFNLTNQIRIGREDSELARRLAREAAGVPK